MQPTNPLILLTLLEFGLIGSGQPATFSTRVEKSAVLLLAENSEKEKSDKGEKGDKGDKGEKPGPTGGSYDQGPRRDIVS